MHNGIDVLFEGRVVYKIINNKVNFKGEGACLEEGPKSVCLLLDKITVDDQVNTSPWHVTQKLPQNLSFARKLARSS